MLRLRVAEQKGFQWLFKDGTERQLTCILAEKSDNINNNFSPAMAMM